MTPFLMEEKEGDELKILHNDFLSFECRPVRDGRVEIPRPQTSYCFVHLRFITRLHQQRQREINVGTFRVF